MSEKPRTPEEKAERKIEKQLESDGWHHRENTTGREYYDDKVELPNGLEADYILYCNDDPIGIIEAKKPSIDPMKHREQAKNYAKSMRDRFGDKYSVPFLFASNGEKIAIEDVRKSSRSPRYIEGFYSPQEILRRSRLEPDKSIEYLKNQYWDDIDEELWENQQEGLEKVKESILSRDDKILLTMATGSGKTRLAMALCYLLLESERVNRVLFLPDTSELRRDSLQDFKKYEPINSKKLSDKYLVGNFDEHKEEDKNLNVVVDTIQKVSRRFEENMEKQNCGEFDLVIADECHRGVHNSDGYAKVLDYYDAIEIGLTATPHQDTIKRYNKNWVYRYEYEDALNDGKVVPFLPRIIQTDVTMNGYTDPETGEKYNPGEIGKKVNIDETNKIIARELLKEIDIDNELTLVFAQSTDHADNIERNFTEVFDMETDIENPSDVVTVITGEQRHAKHQLQEFKKQDRNPRVAVTVDMVTTGVDIKPLNNLVFIRSVKSPILFNQMMGRGTRNIPQKEMFRAFDCVGVFEHHSDGMFSTDNINIQAGESGDSTTEEPVIGDSPETKEITDKEADRLIKSDNGYPIKTQGQIQIVDAEKFVKEVSMTVQARKESIISQTNGCKDIDEADEIIEDILKEECKFFTIDYILKATENHNTLFELCYEVLNKEYSFRSNAERAKTVVLEKHDIGEENMKWIDDIATKAVKESRTIELKDLLSKPFSNYGGYDKARDIFGEEKIKEIIETFNHNFLSLSS